MRVSTFSKLGVTVGAAALLATALVSPAYADPPAPGGNPTYGDLVGLGSDTTQDLVNGIALAIGGGKLASYDAVGSPTVVTRDGGITVPRASGSGSGRDLLRVAIGQTPSATITVPGGTAPVNAANSVGAIDFARSSSGPAAGDTTGTGVLTYVPFARDALTIAVNPDSPLAVVPWILGDSSTAGSTTPSLYNVYRGDIRFAFISGSAGSYAYVGVGATAGAAPDGSSAYAVQALIPQAGSGTRSYYIGKLGLTEAQITTINTTSPGTIKATYGAGLAIEEHDGSALESDLTAIAPFSIGQWVAQANGIAGVNDRRHGAILLPLNGTAPISGTTGNYAANAAFSAMVRDVYNIVPSKLIDDPTSDVAAAFKGSTSLVCQQTSTILEYGFQLMPGGTAATTCGYDQLRAYTGSNSSITFDVDDTSVEAGDEITASVTVTSNANQGGTVFIVDGDDNDVASGEVEAGETAAEFPVTLDDVGTTQLHAVFVPTLTGINGSTSGEKAISVAGRSTVTAVSGATAAQLGKTYGVVVWIDEADPAGGTVTLKDGATTLATGTLAPGEQGAYLTFVPSKLSYSLIASYAPPASSIYTGSSSSAKSLTVGKGLPTFTVPTPKTVKHTSAGKVSVTVVGVTGAVPTGTVTIKVGTTTVGTGTLVNGKVTVTLKKMSKGTKTLVISYSGDTNWLTATKTGVKIKLT